MTTDKKRIEFHQMMAKKAEAELEFWKKEIRFHEDKILKLSSKIYSHQHEDQALKLKNKKEKFTELP